ncbi:hypothetical protein L9F63_019157, partial [Diploptera punctata]
FRSLSPSSVAGRPEATDDGDKLRNCSIEEKGYEGSSRYGNIERSSSFSLSMSQYRRHKQDVSMDGMLENNETTSNDTNLFVGSICYQIMRRGYLSPLGVLFPWRSCSVSAAVGPGKKNRNEGAGCESGHSSISCSASRSLGCPRPQMYRVLQTTMNYLHNNCQFAISKICSMLNKNNSSSKFNANKNPKEKVK